MVLLFFINMQSSTSIAAHGETVSTLAESLIGIPHNSGGTSPEEGFDSSGFVYYTYKKSLNFKIPRSSYQQWLLGESVQKENLVSGDVVFFQGSSGLVPGIYTGNGNVAVVTASEGVALKSLETDSFWAPRYHGAKRYIVNASTTPITNLVFSLAGAPYISEGFSPEDGFCTSGFVWYVFKEAGGVNLPRHSQEQWAMGLNVKKENLRVDDVVFFRGTSSLVPGIYLGNGLVAISTVSDGVTILSLEMDSFWAPCYYGAKRFSNNGKTTPVRDLAFSLIGCPYTSGGYSPSEGFCTSGFVWYVFKEGRGTILPQQSLELWTLGTKVEKADLALDDVVFFEGDSSLIPGIYVGNGLVALVTNSDGVAICSLETDSFWAPRYYGAKRYYTSRPKSLYYGTNQVVKTAVELIGSPYLAGGTTPEGFSSTGFIQYAYKKASGIIVPTSATMCQELGKDIAKTDILEGDILFFEGSENLIPAIYKGNDIFIVVTTSEGVMERHLLYDNYWAPRYLFARRLTDKDYSYLDPEYYKNHKNPILRSAVNFIGTPYLLGGDNPNTGIDCSYFVQMVFNEAGNIHLPRSTSQQWEVGQKIILPNIRAGDVIYFSDTPDKGVAHAGIHLGEGYFIHASGSEGKVSLGFLSSYWKSYITGIRRFDDLTLSLENPIVFEAAKHIGTPYVSGGESPQGFDTGGFLYYVFGKLDKSIPRYPSKQWAEGIAVDKEKLKPGDVVFFQGSNSLLSGIYSGEGLFIIVTSSSGVAIRNLNTDVYWSPKYCGARRY
jgi:cell wall-associated NlpC family hydrolase